MGEWLLSRRDRLIVARHEVPGKRPSKEPSRRARYDRPQLIPQVFLVENVRDTAFEISSLQSSNRCYTPARIIPCPTGRLFWGGALPGTSCQATIMLSLWDENDSAPSL